MRTHTVTFEDGDITLKRPTYGQMREMGEKIAELYGRDSASEVIFDPLFDEVMRAACDTEEDYDRLQELDQNEVWTVWNEYLEFGRFEDFFGGAAEQQASRATAQLENTLRHATARAELMKKSGFGQDDSLMTALVREVTAAKAQKASASGSEKPISEVVAEKFTTRSPSTFTPTSTGGRPNKSRK